MIPATHSTVSSRYIFHGTIFIIFIYGLEKEKKIIGTLSFNNKCAMSRVYYLYTVCFYLLEVLLL